MVSPTCYAAVVPIDNRAEPQETKSAFVRAGDVTTGNMQLVYG